VHVVEDEGYMVHERERSLEDRVAERLARIGTLASVISLLVLIAVVFGNILLLVLKVALDLVLVVVVNQGPAAAAVLGGISTAITHYGRIRVLRGRERFSLRGEAADQAMDQAGAALQNASHEVRSRLGCSSTVSMGVLGTALVLCALTYLPPPLHVFGANTALSVPPVGVVSTAVSTQTSVATNPPTALPTKQASPTRAPSATATRRPTPTATPTPPPGKLLVLTPTVNLGNYCVQQFSGAEFSFTNNGGTTIYWTVKLPASFTLETNDPYTGSLQPFEGDSQNEFFQGTKDATTIVIDWGYSPSSESQTAKVTTTCNPLG
jgi:hypothetical protein